MNGKNVNNIHFCKYSGLTPWIPTFGQLGTPTPGGVLRTTRKILLYDREVNLRLYLPNPELIHSRVE